MSDLCYANLCISSIQLKVIHAAHFSDNMLMSFASLDALSHDIMQMCLQATLIYHIPYGNRRHNIMIW